MAEEGFPSMRVADVADRAGKSRSWAGKYREMLIAEQVIAQADYGYVKFPIPHMGEEYIKCRRPRG